MTGPAIEPRLAGGARRVRAERGFTLLEVLLAFVIAILALLALFSGALAGLGSTRTASLYEQALARARSHLAAETIAPTPGDREGSDGGGFRWRVAVHPVEVFRPKREEGIGIPGLQAQATALTLYGIEAEVSWGSPGNSRAVRLATERVVAGPAATR